MVSKASQLLSLEQTSSQLSDFDLCKTISGEFKGNFSDTLYVRVS